MDSIVGNDSMVDIIKSAEAMLSAFQIAAGISDSQSTAHVPGSNQLTSSQMESIRGESQTVPQSEDTDDCVIVEPVSAAATVGIPARNGRRRRRLASAVPVTESIVLDDSVIEANDDSVILVQSQDTSNDTSAINSARTAKQKSDIEESSPTARSVDCPICFESVFTVGASSTVCGHLFCHACIKQAVTSIKMCPLCKRKLKQSQVHPIYFN